MHVLPALTGLSLDTIHMILLTLALLQPRQLAIQQTRQHMLLFLTIPSGG
jgi:hypothetical protein